MKGKSLPNQPEMELRKGTSDTILGRKQNYNKNAGPKHNRRSTQLPRQNNITSSRVNYLQNFSGTKKRPPVAWWTKECEGEENSEGRIWKTLTRPKNRN